MNSYVKGPYDQGLIIAQQSKDVKCQCDNGIMLTLSNSSILSCLLAQTPVPTSETRAAEMRHYRQWNAFMYTLGIVFMYLCITALFVFRNYFHLKRSEVKHVVDTPFRKLEKDKPDPNCPMVRSGLKKQMCAHLIRMGQLQSNLAKPNLNRRTSSCQTDAWSEASSPEERSPLLRITSSRRRRLLLPQYTVEESDEDGSMSDDESSVGSARNQDVESVEIRRPRFRFSLKSPTLPRIVIESGDEEANDYDNSNRSNATQVTQYGSFEELERVPASTEVLVGTSTQCELGAQRGVLRQPAHTSEPDNDRSAVPQQIFANGKEFFIEPLEEIEHITVNCCKTSTNSADPLLVSTPAEPQKPTLARNVTFDESSFVDDAVPHDPPASAVSSPTELGIASHYHESVPHCHDIVPQYQDTVPRCNHSVPQYHTIQHMAPMSETLISSGSSFMVQNHSVPRYLPVSRNSVESYFEEHDPRVPLRHKFSRNMSFDNPSFDETQDVPHETNMRGKTSCIKPPVVDNDNKNEGKRWHFMGTLLAAKSPDYAINDDSQHHKYSVNVVRSAGEPTTQLDYEAIDGDRLLQMQLLDNAPEQHVSTYEVVGHQKNNNGTADNFASHESEEMNTGTAADQSSKKDHNITYDEPRVVGLDTADEITQPTEDTLSSNKHLSSVGNEPNAATVSESVQQQSSNQLNSVVPTQIEAKLSEISQQPNAVPLSTSEENCLLPSTSGNGVANPYVAPSLSLNNMAYHLAVASKYHNAFVAKAGQSRENSQQGRTQSGKNDQAVQGKYRGTQFDDESAER